MKRDRTGEELPDLELVGWDGHVAHHRRVAREALPPREPEPRGYGVRRVGLKATIAARKRQAARPWR